MGVGKWMLTGLMLLSLGFSIATQFLNPDMTRTRLLFEFWWLYLMTLIICLIWMWFIMREE